MVNKFVKSHSKTPIPLENSLSVYLSQPQRSLDFYVASPERKQVWVLALSQFLPEGVDAEIVDAPVAGSSRLTPSTSQQPHQQHPAEAHNPFGEFQQDEGLDQGLPQRFACMLILPSSLWCCGLGRSERENLFSLSCVAARGRVFFGGGIPPVFFSPSLCLRVYWICVGTTGLDPVTNTYHLDTAFFTDPAQLETYQSLDPQQQADYNRQMFEYEEGLEAEMLQQQQQQQQQLQVR